MAKEDENVTIKYLSGRKEEISHDLRSLRDGDVFTVRDRAGQLTGRTMIVIYNKNGFPQCLSLCSHIGYDPEPVDNFTEHNWRFWPNDRPNLDTEPEMVNIYLSHRAAKLKWGSWVNFRQQWTVQQVGFRREGTVENMGEFMRKYLDIHDGVYGHWRPVGPSVDEGMESKQPQAARQGTTKRKRSGDIIYDGETV